MFLYIEHYAHIKATADLELEDLVPDLLQCDLGQIS